MSSLAARFGAVRRGGGGRIARARALAGRLAAAATALDPGVVLAAALGAGFAALAFGAEGGVAIEPLTWAEVAVVLAGGALAALALAGPHRHARLEPFHGRWALAGVVLLTALTALSIVWSVAPADSWLEANRTLSYLAAFGGGLAFARVAPGRWPALLHGVALACVAVCGWALLTKVFPGTLAESEQFARLRAPFGYWNAVGLMAACGVPPLLWLAARRSGHAAVNALAYPGLGILFVTLMLAYSRGALLALLFGLVVWFAAVPLRLRGTTALFASGLAAAGVVAWAFGQRGLTEDRLPIVERADAGHELGLLLALMVVVLLGVGLAIGFAVAARAPSRRARQLAGTLVLGGIAAALAGGLIALATAPGGIDGQVSKAWNQLTDPAARTPANSPDRLTATASVRARYWREALKVHEDSLLVGAGAGSYATARKLYRTSNLDVQHAHGYVVQTLADLGWAGLIVSLAALAAWLAAAGGVLGFRRSDRRLPFDAERIGMLTLAAVVVVFGMHSLVDWTWFIPANAVLALVCAGWIVGRPPLLDRLRAHVQTSAAERARSRWPLRTRLVAWRPAPYRTALAAGVLVITMAVCWTIVQPLRAVHAGDAALVRLQLGAIDAAADIARIGSERNPLSVEPLWELADIQASAGRTIEAHKALERAVTLQPANAEAWRRLGRYRLHALNQPEAALSAFEAAYYLDPQSLDSASDYLEVSRRPPAGSPAP